MTSAADTESLGSWICLLKFGDPSFTSVFSPGVAEANVGTVRILVLRELLGAGCPCLLPTSLVARERFGAKDAA